MRRFLTLMLAFTVAGTALLAEKAKTADDIDKAMKKVGTTLQAVNKANNAMQYVEAKKQLEIVENTLKDAENFWVVNKKADAQQFSKDTLAKLDVLEKELSAAKPDSTKVTQAYRDAATSCNSCHKVYRGTDANNQFIIKPGTV